MNRNMQLAQFTGKLAYFMKKGTPLKKAIRNTMGDLRDSRLKKSFENIALQLEDGLPFWKALESSERVYPGHAIKIIKAGETKEKLAETLEETAIYLEEEEILEKDVMSAIRFPAIPINVLCLIFSYIFICFIPFIMEMFNGMDLTLPLPTQIIVFFAEAFKNPLFLLFFFGFLAVFDFVVLSGNVLTKKILYKLPLSGSLIKKLYTSKTARAATLMMKYGIPLQESIDILSKDPDFEPIEPSLERLSSSLNQGNRFSIASKESGMFPSLASWMFERIDNANALEKFLQATAVIYRDNLGSLVCKSGKALSATFTIIIFGILAIIVISVFLPLYQLIGRLQ